MKLNKRKLWLWLSEVVYMGHRLTAQGVSPDPNKVNAIVNMPRPVDKKGVERCLGCVTYLLWNMERQMRQKYELY